MPPSWAMYGVDANGDGVKDPYNPVDAIFAAARYLKAAGADTDLSRAIFAYNHADWYVESVLLRARVIGGMPADLVGSLTGLTQGHFPVAARATYADGLDAKAATRRVEGGNAAVPVEGDPSRRSINVFARAGAPVIAVNDGRIVELGKNEQTRPLRRAAGRVRQPLHVQPPRLAREQVPGAEAARAGRAAARRARAAEGRREADGPAASRRQAAAPRDRGKKRVGSERTDAATAADAPAVDEGAPVRAPGAARRLRRRRQRQLEELGEPLESFDGYFTAGARARPARLPAQAAAARLLRDRRHDPRPHRQDRRDARAARRVRDPPGRPRRSADRPEADPRRLEAARVDGDLPREGQERVRRRQRERPVDRPDHADEQGAAPAHRARRPAPRRSTAAGARTSRPARSTGACWRRSSSSRRAG